MSGAPQGSPPTAPAFTTTPKLSLRTGTVNTTAVPVTLGWKATDDQALRQVKLVSPTAATFHDRLQPHRQLGYGHHLVDAGVRLRR